MTTKTKTVAGGRGHVWSLCRCVIALSVAATFTTVATSAHAQIFDFEDISTDPNVIALPSLGDFDQNLANQLNAQTIKAARVVGNGLTSQQASDWFGAVDFDFVFADFEGLLATTRTANLVSQINSFTPNTIVGNFELDPLRPDNTNPSPNSGFTVGAYLASGVNASTESLYPGAPDFRNPASSNSNAPNIRSGLFTLPLTRFSNVEAQRNETIEIFGFQFGVFPESDQHIPYVTRFNNWLNNDLDNGSHPDHEYVFDTTVDDPEFKDQLLSRGDFSALVAHYEMRGADGVILFQPGVVGYTKEQMQDDALEGFNLTDPIANAETATIDTTVSLLDENDDVIQQSIEEAGVVWSGVFNPDSVLILLSNLTDEEETVVLPDEINGFDLDETQFVIGATDHLLLEYNFFSDTIDDILVEGYLLASQNDVFVDDNRAGLGVPEPASLVMLGLGCLLIGLPRSRRR